ncbi:MAG: hypothetical protein JWM61_2864 [Micrococcaceae bacterium]|jgi:hypothetical protein|uniref:hypothetical protein n=1 Tax=Arthrobacter TaxID=1663 RepID=UPI001601199E|nr:MULTISPECIES: hypothetical protein [Arthrobacter]MCU1634212.1 hypothetical protein [Micrococcaceae bacterium]MEC5198161.1 hypothetical protein [Arthrobacter sp. PL16]
MSTEGTNRNDDDQADSQGVGPEGTIPAGADGVAAGTMDEPSNFEPEEDDDGA